jgi:hypothetical protein
LLASATFPSPKRPLGIRRSFRVAPGEVPRSLVPRSRYAVGHFLGLAVFQHRAMPTTLSSQHVLSEFSVPPECCPTQPSSSAEANELLSWALIPFSTCRMQRSTCCGHTRPLRSAFRVWSPSWRLTPSAPGPVLFHTGSALGIYPSELSPHRRYPPRFRDG